MGLIKESGAGGVTAFFMYPVEVDSAEVHNQRFLSAEFLQTFKHAAEKAHELGLRFGIAGGTGWPFGGPTVSQDDAAQQIRRIEVRPDGKQGTIARPALRPGEKVLAVFAGTNDVTKFFAESGAVQAVTNFAGSLSFFVTGPTGMEVKRAALGGEGLVLDHYSQRAAERYLNRVVAPMLDASPGLVDSVFCDSLEVYRANWTSELPAQFQASRHRPLVPLLPALFDGSLPGSESARFDFWRTLAETTETRFTRVVSEWSHRHGIQFEMEAYGTPPNPLTAARYIDVPTGEQYEWRGFSLSRLASSGAHLSGRRLIGAEAWTWLGLPNRLADSLSDTKLCSDLHYLAGINDLTGVDFAYSPRSAGQPGWLPYYGPCFNQNNPQWPWFKHLMAYTRRCNWLLRQGRPVADVALYLPVEDKFAGSSIEQMTLGFELRDHFVSGPKTDEFGLQTALRHHSDLIDALYARGLNFDGIDFFTMNRAAQARAGHLRVGDGDYTLLVLPRLIAIEANSLEKIAAFCSSGGTVLVTGRLPRRVYGLKRSLPDGTVWPPYTALFGEHPDTSAPWVRSYKRGRVIFVPDEKESLRRALQSIRSDLLLEPAQPEVGVTHRQVDSWDIYFLANTSDHPVSFAATTRARERGIEFWDALSGETRPAPVVRASEGSGRVSVALPARGSIFMVVGGTPRQPPEPEPHWQNEEITAQWGLRFQGPNSPPSRVLERLVSWTDWPESRFYSGAAVYTGELVWNHASPRRALLGFSEMHEVAEVRVNGANAGPAWLPPYEVDITQWLTPGTNRLEITVANLPLNRFLGTPEQDLTALRAKFGNRFPAPEEKRIHPAPAPSGIIGPVRIRFCFN
jgi:hypothetical protein